MRIKSSTILLGLVLFIGCAPKTTPSVIVPPAPIQTESVQPSLQKVQIGINESVKSNEKFDVKLREQVQIVTHQNLEIKEALSQAEKIKEKTLANQLITELEASNLIIEIKKVQQRNMFLDVQNKEMEKIRLEQLNILKSTKEESVNTQMKLLAKEQETLELRNHAQFLATNLEKKNNEVIDLQKALVKEKVHAARSTVYRNWIFILVGGFILWTVIKNVIMIYSPIKFRI